MNNYRVINMLQVFLRFSSPLREMSLWLQAATSAACKHGYSFIFRPILLNFSRKFLALDLHLHAGMSEFHFLWKLFSKGMASSWYNTRLLLVFICVLLNCKVSWSIKLSGVWIISDRFISKRSPWLKIGTSLHRHRLLFTNASSG